MRHIEARGEVIAIVLAVAAATFLASCGGSGRFVGAQTLPGSAMYLKNAPEPLVTPTYEGSGQIVHPSIVRFQSAWHGYKYWLVMTPYPYSHKKVENPSILVSNDGKNWIVPPGLTNPIAWPATSFLADPDIFYDSTSDQLWVYYTEINVQGHTRVMLTSSGDGLHWSAGEQLTLLPDYQLVSPAVEKVGSTYYMWSVNAGSVGGCAEVMTVEMRSSADGRNWSAPRPVNIATSGYRIWHLEVIDVPSKGEKWMLATASPLSVKCVETSMQLFARSSDGLNWEWLPKVALGPGKTWDNSHIYRSTMLYDSARDMLEVWYPGRNGSTGIWHMGYTSTNYTRFLEWMEQ